MASKVLVILGGILALGLIGWLFREIDVSSKSAQIMTYLENDVEPNTAAIALLGITAISIPMFFTTSPMNLSAGAILGVGFGSVVITLGCLLGAIVSFVVARYFCRDWAKKKLEESPMLRKLDIAVQTEGFTIIVLSRLSPVFPFALLSFVFGVTGIDIQRYSLGTCLGLLPGVVLYCWIGSSMKTMATSEGGSSDYGLWLSIAASVVSIAVISKVAKRILDEATEKTDKGKRNK